MNRLFKLTLLQPEFDSLYKKFEQSFGALEEKITNNRKGVIIFPEEMINKLPPDIQNVCKEFNFNFDNQKPWASILLLRRLLPLAIVRKFQKKGIEFEIKPNGEYLETKALLGKIEHHLSEKRIYKEILNYKILTDSSQHSYTFLPELSDVEGAAIKIRLLLQDLFP